MADPERCDLAVWDVRGDLTDTLRSRLERTTKRVGQKIAVDYGWLNGSALAVARPRRLTAAQLPSTAEALSALVAAHKPSKLAVVGPAAARTSAAEVGETVLGAKLDEVSDFAADWTAAARRAFESTGLPGELLAVVVRVVENDQPLAAPPSRRPTRARNAGRLLRTLLGSGASSSDESTRSLSRYNESVATAVTTLLGS